jgi:hypothetical protein
MTNWKSSKNVFRTLRNSIIASKLFEILTISDTRKDFPNYSNEFKAINYNQPRPMLVSFSLLRCVCLLRKIIFYFSDKFS